MQLEQFCGQLPKVELHAHLNGSISDSTIKRLVQHKQQCEPGWCPPAEWGVTINAGQQRSLDHCFAIFKLIHELCTTEEVAYMVTCDVLKEFAADNVKYIELRTTPRDVAATKMTKRSYIEAVLRAIKDMREQEDIVVRLLLAVDRRVTVAEAEDVVNLASALKEETGGIVIGVDLSGDPSKGDIMSFIPVFKIAKDKGLKLALHLAEAAFNVEETWDLMESILPDRIGHGTFLHPEVGGMDSLVQIVEKHRIPLEVCLTSNIKSGTVKTLSDHHLGYWLNKRHPLAISTDDKGVFCTSLSKEYHLTAETFNLDKNKLFEMSESAIEYIFAEEDVKEKLRNTWKVSKKDLLGSEG